ncbi:MAG: hypothetical protein ACYTBZ_27665 [Planctomycetota bacterium]|jgi:hypothetical protein
MEQTDKYYKGWMLTGVLIACAGCVLTGLDYMRTGTVIALTGLLVYGLGKMNAWWRHG